MKYTLWANQIGFNHENADPVKIVCDRQPVNQDDWDYIHATLAEMTDDIEDGYTLIKLTLPENPIVVLVDEHEMTVENFIPAKQLTSVQTAKQTLYRVVNSMGETFIEFLLPDTMTVKKLPSDTVIAETWVKSTLKAMQSEVGARQIIQNAHGENCENAQKAHDELSRDLFNRALRSQYIVPERPQKQDYQVTTYRPMGMSIAEWDETNKRQIDAYETALNGYKIAFDVFHAVMLDTFDRTMPVYLTIAEAITAERYLMGYRLEFAGSSIALDTYRLDCKRAGYVKVISVGHDDGFPMGVFELKVTDTIVAIPTANEYHLHYSIQTRINKTICGYELSIHKVGDSDFDGIRLYLQHDWYRTPEHDLMYKHVAKFNMSSTNAGLDVIEMRMRFLAVMTPIALRWNIQTDVNAED